MRTFKKAIIAGTLVLAGISASASDLNESNGKKYLYVDVNTKSGQEILKSEMDYRNYLSKKLNRDMADKSKVEKFRNDCEDIGNIKAAVAKLILESNKDAETRMKVDNLSNKVDRKLL